MFGALEMCRARKGVFISTSEFSREALGYIGLIEEKVVLIDGRLLAELMVQYNLGVAPKETYPIKKSIVIILMTIKNTRLKTQKVSACDGPHTFWLN